MVSVVAKMMKIAVARLVLVLMMVRGLAAEVVDDVTPNGPLASPPLRLFPVTASTEVGDGKVGEGKAEDGHKENGDEDVVKEKTVTLFEWTEQEKPEEAPFLSSPSSSSSSSSSSTSSSSSVTPHLPQAQTLQAGLKALSLRQAVPAGGTGLSQVVSPGQVVGAGQGGNLQVGPQTLQAINFGRIPSSCSLCSRERNVCRIISGIFTRASLPYGYSLVTPVPAGVCNVTITEMKPSKNFFALRRTDGSYVLNGNWDIQAAGRYEAGGTMFTYTPSGDTLGEQLSAPGPLTQPVELMLISQSPNPGIKYEYRVPLPEYLGTGGSGVGVQSPSIHGGSGGLRIPQGGIKPGVSGLGSQPLGSGRLPYGPSNPNIASRGILPLTPVLTPIATGTGGETFPSNTGGQFPPVRLQGSGARGVAGTSPQSPSFVSTQARRQPINPSGGARIVPGSSLGSSSLPRPWTPTFGASDGRNPLGTAFQFPAGSGSATASSSVGFADQSIYPQSHPDVGSQEAPREDRQRSGFPPQFPKNSVPLRPIPIPSSPTHQATDPHRTRHHHGSKGRRKGSGKGPRKIPIRPQTPYGPGVQLTQPNPAPVNPDTAANGTETQEGKQQNDQQRRSRQRGGEGKGAGTRGRRGRKKRKSRFQWVEKGLTPCTKPCGGGNQTMLLSCERTRKGRVVADRHCSQLPRPDTHTITCNLKPCPAKWVPGEWGPCSATCGMGIQTRPLVCRQEVSPTFTMSVPEGACLSPSTVPVSQVCELRPCTSDGPVWEVGSWSNCSAPCGLGSRSRDVFCTVGGRTVREEECQGDRPSEDEVCDMGSCATNTWFFSEWSEKCSETCGVGLQTRKVHCLAGSGDGPCGVEIRPAASRTCRGDSGCGGHWFTGPWSGCSEECGAGRETRAVFCATLTRGQWKVVGDASCIAHERPPHARDCSLPACPPEWFTSQWSQCSASCGGGVMRREVTCLDALQQPSSDCFNTTRPSSRQPCNLHHCSSTSATGHAEETQHALTNSSSQHTDEGKEEEQTEKEAKNNDGQLMSGGKEVLAKPDVDTLDQSHEVQKEDEEKDDDDVENELVLEEEPPINVVPDTDAQGDESVAETEDNNEDGNEDNTDVEKKKKRKKEKKKGRKNTDINEEPPESPPEAETPAITCIDRIKNCHLVFRARLCRLKYYNKLCCRTCSAS